jgi:2-keto-4-pentenoate hydratase/2-oxohepta-3-ene-1,7-dioic acid hydratase in catechol pathway
MKLVSFRVADRVSYGVLDGQTIRDAGAVLGPACGDLKAVLSDAGGLAQLRQSTSAAPAVPLSGAALLPPIPNPSKIFCIGHNYEEHRSEMGRAKTAHPAVFTRFADSQVGHDQDAWIPRESIEIDFEGEMAVVIGTPGRRIAPERALEYVAGYACYNDISVRDWQRHTSQFTPGKNFPRTGAFGPCIVTADEIPDPQKLDLTTRLNGRTMQQANTAQMIFQVADLIAYCSSFTPLSPGDVIVSGTPGGVGVRRDPQVFLKTGDIVEIEISSIGTLRSRLVAEPDVPVS